MRDATYYLDRAARAGVLVRPENVAAYAAASLASVPLDPSAKTGRYTVQVRVNHGRWIVECPNCHGALFAHPADPRFLCVDCGNNVIGGEYRRVIWPKDADTVVAILEQRPDVSTRNWEPGESLADLRRENKVLLP